MSSIEPTFSDSPGVPSLGATHRPAPGRPPRRRRSPWPLRILILAVVALLAGVLVRSSRAKPIAVDVVRVERTTVEDEVSSESAGEVMAERDATIRTELSGRVMAIEHKRGERVHKSQRVLALDPDDLDARLRQAQATLDVERAQAAQSDVHADATAKTAARLRKLADHGAETASAAEDAAAQARESLASARAAHAQVEQSEAALQVARVARSHADLTAPFDGVLADVFVHVGDEAPMGANAFELVDDSRLRVEAPMDEADIGKVRVGQAASLRLDAMPDRSVEGIVSKLDPTVRKDDKGARTLRIEVEVKDLAKAVGAGLRPGMSANVDVEVAQKLNVLSLPTNVIVGRGTKRSVYLVEKGVVRERPIQIGMSSWKRTEVVSGVKEGDEVVSNLNVKGLADGVAVVRSGEGMP